MLVSTYIDLNPPRVYMQSPLPPPSPQHTLSFSKCLVAQSCPTLCEPMDCSLPGSSIPGDSQSKDTEVGCHVLLQGIFSTPGLNPGFSHCRQIFYCLSHPVRPRIQEWVLGLLHVRPVLYQLSYQVKFLSLFSLSKKP